MSADKLGEILGKDRSTIYRYENGDIEKLPIDILKPIAEALRTTPEELLGWDYKEEPEELADYVVKVISNDRVKHMIDIYIGLDESEQDLVDALMEKLKKKE